MRKTKIICTLGPATDRDGILEQCIESGMNVARLNFSHGSHEEQQKRIDKLYELRKKYQKPIAALLDTKGPEIRLGDFKDGKVNLKQGQKFSLVTNEVLGDETKAYVTYKQLPEDVEPGTRILMDDGLVEMIVEAVDETQIDCVVVGDCELKNHKGVNVPGLHLNMPYMSEKDKSDIIFGINNHVDFIAASDGIMVARGDMGVELPEEEVPILQKMIIGKVYEAGKQVITATQMLDSMMKNPRPTRAEVADVANAIYDGTSAIMLSGETAAGKYPVESVQTMVRIANRTEADIDYEKRFYHRGRHEKPDVTEAVCHATCTTAYDLNASAIVAVTKSGRTARMISRYRPACPVLGGTTSKRVWRQMAMSWGVCPILLDEKTDVFALFDHAVDKGKCSGLLKSGDLAVITSGVPIGISGTTNMLKVVNVE